MVQSVGGGFVVDDEKLRFYFGGTVRVFDRNLHSRMPLDPTHVRLKHWHACDQWNSSRVFTPLTG
jgi:hypothetical protein